MSKYEQGRADRAAGKSTAPGSGVFSSLGEGLTSPFRSEKEQERLDRERAEWREGWHDKDREIKQEKKKH